MIPMNNIGREERALMFLLRILIWLLSVPFLYPLGGLMGGVLCALVALALSVVLLGVGAAFVVVMPFVGLWNETARVVDRPDLMLTDKVGLLGRLKEFQERATKREQRD